MVETHEHQWHIDEQEPATYEGQTITIRELCEFVEINGSYHSERHDETFYDEGEACGAMRLTKFGVSDPIHVDSGETIDYADETVLVEALDMKLYTEVTGYDAMHGHDEHHRPQSEPLVLQWYTVHSGVDTSDKEITIRHDGEEYRFDVEYANQSTSGGLL